MTDAVNNPDLQKLLEGNARYVASNLTHPNQSAERRDELSQGQHPFAIILSCADSRVPPEVVFDQGLGDLFVVRVAGNVADPVVMASIEYAVLHLDVSLIMVMGHSQCGAVGAACSRGEFDGHIPSLMAALEGPFQSAKDQPGDLVQNVTFENARQVSEQLKQTGDQFADLVADNKLTVVPASYEVETGKVSLL